MFTDKEIIQLHKDKKYKKTNSFFTNVHLSFAIVKSGLGGASVSISTEGTISFSTAIISVFWTFLRYVFITREITKCRSRIIEGLLNTSFVIAPDKLIKNSVGSRNTWLEYNKNKISVVGSICIEYIDTAEHRKILASYSYITDDDTLTQAFQKVRMELEQIFILANNELAQKEIKEALQNYTTALDNPECVTMLLDTFIKNSYEGNLTIANDSEEGVPSDS